MKKQLLKWINILVMLASIMIIIVLSIETLSTKIILSQKLILNFQLVVCCIFIVDFFARLLLSDKKLRFILYNFPLLLVSIPYLNIVSWFGISIGHQLHLIFRTLPLIRGIYGVAIMIGWVTRNKFNNLFYSYVITIISVTYYSSIMFYAVEKGVNSQVTNYWDALWWACMDVTTVGSNIYGVTFLGQLLAAVLAGAGMMMFPIFTAYITNVYTNKMKAISKKS